MRSIKCYLFLMALLGILFFTSSAESSDVVIVGDTRLKPVSDVVNVIRDMLPHETSVYLPQDIKGRLAATLGNEKAKVVVALGSEALSSAMSLPESVPVVYGLLIKPANTKRQNISGIYLATPVGEYVGLLNRYFPGIRRIGVVYEPSVSDLVAAASATSQVTLYTATNSYEFIRGINTLGRSVDALLLLPEKNLLTATSVEELYRYSFSEKIPAMGISEKHVKMGSLLAIVFDDAGMGKQIGNLAKRVISQGTAAGIPPSPPEVFDFYFNTETARTMKINVPSELIRKAKRVYP